MHFGPIWRAMLRNKTGAILIALQLAFTYAPPMQHVFHTAALGWTSWAVILGLGVAKFLAVEAEKAFWRYRRVQQL